jgi:flagellar assembly protein FliH
LSKVISVPKWRNGKPVLNDRFVEKKESAEVSQYNRELEARLKAEAAIKERELNKLIAEAKEELNKAREEAAKEKERIITEAESDAENLKAEAKEQGHAEGYNEGREEGRQQALDEMKDAINSANEQAMKTLKDAKEASLDYMVQAEHDIAEVVLTVAGKVIPQHFIDAPQVILPLVREALLKIKDQKEIFVHVAPDSYDLVLLARDEFRSMLPGGNASLEIVSDESLKPGDCLIETESGALDARVSTQLDLIREAVREVLT